MPVSTVAALQIGSLPGGKAETLEQILSYEDEILRSGAQLVVMPEALLGGYPKGEGFGTQLGYRLPEEREAFARYFANAIDVPGVETEALAGLSARTGASLVLGVIERSGSTLYCTVLYFEPVGGLVARHRKLMPTGTERLIWGKGDGSTLPVIDAAVGRIGGAVCWEQWYPEAARAMMLMGAEILFYPTAIGSEPHDPDLDTSRLWRRAMIGHAVSNVVPVVAANRIGTEEGQCFYGHSFICDERGDMLAEFGATETGVLTATLDLDRVKRHRAAFGFFRDRRPELYGRLVEDR